MFWQNDREEAKFKGDEKANAGKGMETVDVCNSPKKLSQRIELEELGERVGWIFLIE